jgi:hypothetical protein
MFESAPQPRLMCLTIGATEIVSILVRKRNDGRLSREAFSQSLINLYGEVIDNTEFSTITADDQTVIGSIGFIIQHSINSTDAIILASALQINEELQQQQGHKLVLVSSDQRLNRAAQAEGLLVFNPENDDEQILNLAVSPDSR